MDRRDFLKTAGLGAAALGVIACAPKVIEKKETTEVIKIKNLSGKMAQHVPGIGLLGYGCMRWPTVKVEDGQDHINSNQVNHLVDLARQQGVNYFDTSSVYFRGDSERA